VTLQISSAFHLLSSLSPSPLLIHTYISLGTHAHKSSTSALRGKERRREEKRGKRRARKECRRGGGRGRGESRWG